MSDIGAAPADPDRWGPILVAAPEIALARTRIALARTRIALARTRIALAHTRIALARTRQGAEHPNRARSLVVVLL